MNKGPMVGKTVWTDGDYDTMGWHDNAVHAFALEPAPPFPGRLLLDLDYILEWVQPMPPDTNFSFWMCPATLVFDQASDVTGDIDLQTRSFELSLDHLERSGPDEHGVFAWTLAGHEFTIRLRARGFTQFLRHPPIKRPSQRLSVDERGGLSFDEHGYKS